MYILVDVLIFLRCHHSHSLWIDPFSTEFANLHFSFHMVQWVGQNVSAVTGCYIFIILRHNSSMGATSSTQTAQLRRFLLDVCQLRSRWTILAKICSRFRKLLLSLKCSSEHVDCSFDDLAFRVRTFFSQKWKKKL